MTYDALIIGAGPAGCAAAMTLRQRNKAVLMVYAGDGALERAAHVDNYPGLPHISGQALLDAFRTQAQSLDVELRKAMVRQIVAMDDSFSVLVEDQILAARGIILATGTARAITLAGEKELTGQGVSYCATCDGMFYRGKDVAVIAACEEGVKEANFLVTIAHKVIYFVEKPHDFEGLDPDIEVIEQRPRAILGEDHVTAVKTDAGEYAADGVFIARPALPLNQLLPDLAINGSAILTDDKMRTNIPRVYAAGDVSGAPYQIAKAVGEGNIAALTLADEIGGKP